MSKISYDAKVACEDLNSFFGDSPKKPALEPKEKEKDCRVDDCEQKETSFEKHWGCKPEKIVLTRKEEEIWMKRLK